MDRRRLRVALVSAACCVGLSSACAAQTPSTGSGDTQKQIDSLRSQVNAMQKDLDEIKELLAPIRGRRGPSLDGVRLDLGNRPFRGSPTAAVTLVEMTDYQ